MTLLRNVYAATQNAFPYFRVHLFTEAEMRMMESLQPTAT